MSIMEKPQAVAKMHRLYRNIKKNGGRIGTNLRVLELVYSNACNFKCEHCSTRAPLGENADELMPLDKVAELAGEGRGIGRVAGRKGPGRETRLTCGWVRVRWSGRGR